MKVKIGDTIYDASEEPIMLILSDQDKKNIAGMLPHCTKYAAYPDAFESQIDAWMEINE